MSRRARPAVLLLIGLALSVSQASWSQSIVNQFPAPVGSPAWVEGLAWDSNAGQLLFSNAWEIVRLNPVSGATVGSFNASGYINGIDWVANNRMYLARVTPPAIIEVDPTQSGAVVHTIDTSVQGAPEGVCHPPGANQLIFSVDGPPPRLFSVNLSNDAISLLGASSVGDPEALAYGDGALWAGGKSDSFIHKLDPTSGAEIATVPAPASDTHGLAWDGTYLWASAYATQMIYQLDVSSVDSPPVLTYPQAAGYQTDGVDPNSGSSSTVFSFRVVYADPDDDFPWFVQLHLLRGGLEVSGSPFDLNYISGTSYRLGVTFGTTMTLPEDQDYSYYFSAMNANDVAGGPATHPAAGPVVSDAPPVLTWTGEPGYTNDGVEPDAGQPGSTVFAYRVQYTGATAATFVNVHILKDGVPIAHSPFHMTTSDTTPYDGAIYAYARTLQKSRGYTYYFEASDGTQAATGTPTTASSGPIVGNLPPVLAWTGEPGFESRGVSPAVGPPDQSFSYRVTYSDVDGDVPSYVRLHVTQKDTEISGSPFALTLISGDKAKVGLVYGTDLTLALGEEYSYWFEASDGLQPATGTPTAAHDGPIVDAPPHLEWASFGPYVDRGLDRKRGFGPLSCSFRIRYRDIDRDQAQYVRVEITLNGDPIEGSPFAMTLVKPGFPRTGQLYGREVSLRKPGEYAYRFSANDGYLAAQGVPTQWHTGPLVLESPAAQLTALAAVPTSGGVAVTFSLSAAATVDAQVVNLAGRPVQAIATAQTCAAGLNSLLWNGRTSGGLSAPAGTYLVRVTARDASGGQSQGVRPDPLR